MKHTSVKSSNIESVAYDPESKMLEIRFNGGGLYSYADVPQAAYDNLMSAESVGGEFHRSIKGKFEFKRVSSGVTS